MSLVVSHLSVLNETLIIFATGNNSRMNAG